MLVAKKARSFAHNSSNEREWRNYLYRVINGVLWEFMIFVYYHWLQESIDAHSKLYIVHSKYLDWGVSKTVLIKFCWNKKQIECVSVYSQILSIVCSNDVNLYRKLWYLGCFRLSLYVKVHLGWMQNHFIYTWNRKNVSSISLQF